MSPGSEHPLVNHDLPRLPDPTKAALTVPTELSMNSLRFESPLGLTLAILLAVVGVTIVIRGYTRGLTFQTKAVRRWMVLAMVAKCAAVLGLAVMVANPQREIRRPKPGENLVLVAIDGSSSLNLVDAGPSRTGGKSLTRGEALKQRLISSQTQWLEPLQQNFEVRLFQIGDQVRSVTSLDSLTFTDPRSALTRGLRHLEDRFQSRPVAGILFFSDGNRTDGTATESWLPRIPIFPVEVGHTGAAVDVSISSAAVLDTLFEDSPALITAQVQQLRWTGGPLVVELLGDDGQTIEKQTISAPSEGVSAAVPFRVRPTQPGPNRYRLQVTPEDLAAAPHELTLDNNERTVVVDRKTAPIRLLYVGGRPAWEYKFLQRAIAADDQLRLTGLVRIARRQPKFEWRARGSDSGASLFKGFDEAETTESFDQPVLVRLGTETAEELKDGFPTTDVELFQYQGLILDDIEARFFTPDQLTLVERFVVDRGGMLLVLGGPDTFSAGGYAGTPLARLLPALVANRPSEEPTESSRWDFSREGWLEPWARLRKTESEERERLANLPVFEVLSRVRQVKPGAELIWNAVTKAGEVKPGLVVQRFGRGTTAALLWGDLWRWSLAQAKTANSTAPKAVASGTAAHLGGAPSPNDDFGRMWRQLLQSLTKRTPGRLEIELDEGGTGGRFVTVRTTNAGYEPTDDLQVSARLTLPDSQAIDLVAEPVTGAPGVLRFPVDHRPAGVYSLVVSATDQDGRAIPPASLSWVANSAADEVARVAPDSAWLKGLATSSGGQVVPLDGLADFTANFPVKQTTLLETKSISVWHHPLVLLGLVSLLCFEWAVRRWKGLA